MRQVKNKIIEYGFERNHALLIGVAVVVFLVLISPQIKPWLKALTIFAQEEKPATLTYEEVKQSVDLEYGHVGTGYEEFENSQIALLDRTDENGQVLGSAIGVGDIPSIDQLYSPEQLELIRIAGIVPDSEGAIKNYREQIMTIEATNGAYELFSVLNSSDPNELQSSGLKASQIENSMSAIVVPQTLVNYHRYLILYYRTLGQIGSSFAETKNNSDLATYAKTLFSLIDRIGVIKKDIQTNYGVEL